MKIITDDALRSIDITLAARSIGDFMRNAVAGETASPPRSVFRLGDEMLAITAGADAGSFGFRAYSHRAGLQREKEDQIVACWDRETHGLKALAIGELLGAWRTGILGGIAYQNLAGKDAGTCGMIGTGLQAYTQVRAIAELARPSKFLVFSRDQQRRCHFAKELENDTGVQAIAASDVEQLVRQSDALVVATTASRPVFDVSWLERCRHITTVGPKASRQHETPIGVANWAERVASDSPQQIAKQGRDHFLADVLSFDAIEDLSEIVVEGERCDSNVRTLYLSAGLSGTEVAILDALSA